MADKKQSSIERGSVPFVSSVKKRDADSSLRRPPRETKLGSGDFSSLDVALRKKDRQNHIWARNNKKIIAT